MQPKKKDAYEDFFSTLAACDPKTLVLSAISGERSDPFIPPTVSDELPKLMSSLYDPEAENLSYDDLIIRCEVEMLDMCQVSEEMVENVEEKTRD